MLEFDPDNAHGHTRNGALFLTWRLHGTLPYLARPATHGIPEQAFLALDRALDTAASGPKWLENSAVAQCVVSALRFGESHLGLYHLVAFCVMPNHVHIVLEPLAGTEHITRVIRNLTTRNVNQICGRARDPFWQEDTYDHWVEGYRERERIVAYTEYNPVTAGLAQAPEEWPWSSASHTLTAQ